MRIVESRTGMDCAVCALACFMDISYEKAEKYFPPILIEKRKMVEWELIEEVVTLCSDEMALVLFRNTNMQHADLEKPAILEIIVKDESNNDQLHAVCWDGEYIYDPAFDHPHKNFPENIVGIIQNEANC